MLGSLRLLRCAVIDALQRIGRIRCEDAALHDVYDLLGRDPRRTKRKEGNGIRCPLPFCLTQMSRSRLVCGVDSLVGADTCASTAFGASLRVDGILVAFRDGAYRALVDASTACNTIVINYVSHFCLILNSC